MTFTQLLLSAAVHRYKRGTHREFVVGGVQVVGNLCFLLIVPVREGLLRKGHFNVKLRLCFYGDAHTHTSYHRQLIYSRRKNLIPKHSEQSTALRKSLDYTFLQTLPPCGAESCCVIQTSCWSIFWSILTSPLQLVTLLILEQGNISLQVSGFLLHVMSCHKMWHIHLSGSWLEASVSEWDADKTALKFSFRQITGGDLVVLLWSLIKSW